MADINRVSQDAANSGLIDKEKYIIPPHLHDLQEADLPETQRGLVISEIAQFRERAAKREREKMRDVRESIPSVAGAPSGPKAREWGKPQNRQTSPQIPAKAFGKGPQGYNKPMGFVRAEDGNAGRDSVSEERQLQPRTDEELEAERKELRRQDEEISFKDVCARGLYFSYIYLTDEMQRERRYEPRERTRIQALERAIARERTQKEAEERDRIEIKARLEIWDDDESDELFYIDRYVSSSFF